MVYGAQQRLQTPVCLFASMMAALSRSRTSSIHSELDYYDMAATKGTLFFPDNARLFSLCLTSDQSYFIICFFISISHSNE